MDPATQRAIEQRLLEIEGLLEKAQRGLTALARIKQQDAVTDQELKIRQRIKALQTEIGS